MEFQSELRDVELFVEGEGVHGGLDQIGFAFLEFVPLDDFKGLLNVLSRVCLGLELVEDTVLGFILA